MSDKLPAYQFYPGDWSKDHALQQCSLAARGLWVELLNVMHDSPRRGRMESRNGEPLKLAAIARLVRSTAAEVRKLLAELDAAGVYSTDENTGVIYSRRMVRDERLRQVRAEAGQLGGLARGEQSDEQPESEGQASPGQTGSKAEAKPRANARANRKQTDPPSSSSSSSSSSSASSSERDLKSAPADDEKKATDLLLLGYGPETPRPPGFGEFADAWAAAGLPGAPVQRLSHRTAKFQRLCIESQFFRDNWRECVARMGRARYCTHPVKWPGPGVDWFLSGEVPCAQILEGKYDDIARDPGGGKPNLLDAAIAEAEAREAKEREDTK